MTPRKLVARKLLVASVGVATMNYVAVACGGDTTGSSSSQFSDSGGDAVTPPTSGNLGNPPPTSANLPAPPPVDASDDADAADAADAEGG